MYILNKQDFIFFITLFFCLTSNLNAQEKVLTDSSNKSLITLKSYGEIRTLYNSDVIFLGRNSSVKTPFMSTSASYFHKSGLFVNGSASYLTNSSEARFDLFSTTIGYDFFLDQFNSGFSGSVYFFNSQSTTVNSQLTGNLSAYLGRDFGIIDVTTIGTLYFSQNSDFVIYLGANHNFYAINGNLKINPSVSLNAGTQNYFSNYNNNIHFGGGMISGGGPSSMGGGMNKNGNGFTILDYEFSLPVSYTLKKFSISITPIYSIPVSPATIYNGQTTYTEQISNTLFWSVGIKFKIFNQ